MPRKVKQDAVGRFASAGAGSAEPDAKRTHRPTQFKHYRVDEVLSNADRDEYERLLARPTTTVKQLQSFLRERGHSVCRNAISRHRNTFATELKSIKECSRMASAFCEITRRSGPAAVAEANHARFEMMLMQSLFNMKGAPELPREEWQSMAKLTSAAVTTRRNVEALRESVERREREAASAAAAGANDEDLNSYENVVERVRDILGVNIPTPKPQSPDPT